MNSFCYSATSPHLQVLVRNGGKRAESPGRKKRTKLVKSRIFSGFTVLE